MPALCQSLQTSAVFALDLCEAPADDLALWDQHEIEPANDLALVSTEAFTQEPLRAVPLYGTADATSHGQAETTDVLGVLGSEQDEKRPVQPKSLTEDPSKLRRQPDALAGSQSSVRQPLVSRFRRRPACVPFDGDASGPAGLPWCACAPGTRASAYGYDCSVEMCACPSCWRPRRREAPCGFPSDTRKARSLATCPHDCQTACRKSCLVRGPCDNLARR